ncbi:MAG: DUF3899 domain-containing protein [Bacilli bacterium]|jgi:hypothetical protein
MKEEKSRSLPFILYSASLLAVAIIIGVWVFFSGTRPSAQNPFGLLGDALSLAGTLGFLGALLLYISREGYFDIIIYGVKRVFRATYDANYKKSMPQTFMEYKALQRAKRKPAPVALLIVSSVYLALGVIFIILYYTVPLS